MKNTSLLLTASILALAPVTGFAGGLAEAIEPAPVVVAPVPVPTADWSGFYVGGQIGMGEYTLDAPIFDAPASVDTTSYGVHAGYMYDLGSIVLGADVAYSLLDFDEVDADEDVSVLDLTARVGYDAGALLPYLFAGISTVSSSESDESYDGNIIGAGMSYAVSDNILLGGEYATRTFEEDGADLELNGFSLRASYKF